MTTVTTEMMKKARRRAMNAMNAAQDVLQRTDRLNTWAEEKQATEDWAEALAEANAWNEAFPDEV
jgi:hypothetical protein